MTDAGKTAPMTPELLTYVLAHSSVPDPLLGDLAAETARLGEAAELQVAPQQGALLTLLARLSGGRRLLEVGTFTGYSALCLARGLVDGGTLLCCDISDEWTTVARKFWTSAGVADRIELRLGPAADTLRSLPADEQFDLVFLDADKPTYPEYLRLIVPLLRPGGLLVADNVFLRGAVLDDPGTASVGGRAVAEFNSAVRAHPDLFTAMLPIADGMTLALKAG
jgi:caffeoyl-CoA O-methyltransferase